MLRNYIATAWRGLLKNPVYSAINIGGLGTALCACLLILLYLVHEYSYDLFQANRDRTFSIYSVSPADKASFSESMSFMTGPRLAQAAPGVVRYTRVDMFPGKFRLGDVVPRKPLFVDDNFFQQFSFRLDKGDPATVLNRPFTIVLSRTLAQKLYGSEDPVGKRLSYNGKYTFEVTGVAADPPSNAYLDFDALCSLSSFAFMEDKQWTIKMEQNVEPGNFKTYIQLRSAADTASVLHVLRQLAAHHLDTTYYHTTGSYRYALEPMQQEHLEMHVGRATEHEYLRIFSIVAGLILALALINYMSLATARASVRAREIGVRKTLGAGKGNLATQFYVESALYAGLAFALGLLLFGLFKEPFLELLRLHIDDAFTGSPRFIAAAALLMAVTILLAGSYPALVMSAFNPMDNISAPSRGRAVRRVLTVLQFTVATAMIISLTVMKKQIYFFLHKDIGLNREHLLMVRFDRTMAPHYQAFQAEVAALPAVTATSVSLNGLFGGIGMITIQDGAFAANPLMVTDMETDSAFIDALQIRWRLRPTDPFWSADPRNVVLNETAVKALGLPADPRGLRAPGMRVSKIAGVVKDFVFESLIRKPDPVYITASNGSFGGGGTLLIRTRPDADTHALLASLEKIYRRYPSLFPFSYQFADDAFEQLYTTQIRMAGLLGAFTLLTIGIACLGLFGLSTFATLQRTKEVGIRKVLGAGVGTLVGLLTRDFLALVGLAVVIAAPLAWWVMQGWLRQFAYRVTVSPWILIVSGLGVALLAILTVSLQALRTARANPVDSLRNE
ncbi:ABC transporter permease [Dinghuibacter silviterrae]|uniref:Putative ABC transport system permease protein n=1 Tax=Dinghuibacter silviterrae TaxID=1539049 RepID=A0A4R8DSP8_9BACT|nr:ABC transporter permease [Dinghuibacter silviterrae]TDX01260.1 putative ABC transport system permease protein [Dinghuibacter silviterrae]